MALKDGNNGEKYIDRKAIVLGRFYGKAYNQLISEFQKASGTLWQKKRAAAMLVFVEDAIKKMDAQSRIFAKEVIPTTYFAFAREAKADLKKAGVTVSKNFGRIHTQALEVMAEESALGFANAMQGVRRSAREIITRERKIAIQERIGAGAITGEATKGIAKGVKEQLRQDGITGLVDRAGKKWKLDVYAAMIASTQLANASRGGVTNTALEYGFDVVKVTRHGSKHDACAVWEGKQLSLTGKTPGIPTLAEAEAAGLFHVGCRHGYFVDTA